MTQQLDGMARREVTLIRLFDAPRGRVWRAWTEPALMAAWWGPHGFTTPVCEMDVRPGGTLRLVMRAPDGLDHSMSGAFSEVAPRERLAFSSFPEDAQGGHLLDGTTVATFADEGGGTRLTVVSRAVAVVAGAAAMLEGMEQGWRESLDRLAALLARA